MIFRLKILDEFFTGNAAVSFVIRAENEHEARKAASLFRAEQGIESFYPTHCTKSDVWLDPSKTTCAAVNADSTETAVLLAVWSGDEYYPWDFALPDVFD